MRNAQNKGAFAGARPGQVGETVEGRAAEGLFRETAAGAERFPPTLAEEATTAWPVRTRAASSEDAGQRLQTMWCEALWPEGAKEQIPASCEAKWEM